MKCPQRAWLLIVGFLLVAVLACILGFVLNKKKVNLAFVSIGVDYFQVRWRPAFVRLHTRVCVRVPACVLWRVCQSLYVGARQRVCLGMLCAYWSRGGATVFMS